MYPVISVNSFQLVFEMKKRTRKPNKREMVEGLVAFAQASSTSVQALSTGRVALLSLLTAGDAHAVGDAEGELRRWSLKRLRDFQNELLGFLQVLAQTATDGEERRGAILPTITLTIAPVEIGQGEVVLTFDGAARDALWFQLLDVLRTSGTHGLKSIRACPGCGRLFMRRGRRENCSERCYGRRYMQDRRAKGQD